MAHLMAADNLSEAWLGAAEWLLGRHRGKAVHVNVTFTGGTTEALPLRRELDDFLAGLDLYGIQTVANTNLPVRSLPTSPR